MNTINLTDSIIVIIDIQEKLVNMLKDGKIKANAVKIAKASGILNMPAIITEQYPKGLGNTIEEIKTALPNAVYIEKTSFNANDEHDFKEIIKKENKKQIILMGIEAHICVLQTAFSLIQDGYEVFIIQNASGSRDEEDKQTAIKRLTHIGAQIVTTEMVIFELLKSSKHKDFKAVQSLIK